MDKLLKKISAKQSSQSDIDVKIEAKEENDENMEQKIKSTYPIISQIFDGDSNNESLAFSKSMILVILLCLTAYGVYRLCADFIDTIILAALSGVAYKQMRDRFINFMKLQNKPIRKLNGPQVLYAFIELALFFVIPWIRFSSEKEFKEINFSFEEIWHSFHLSTNFLIRITQACLLARIIFTFFGTRLDRTFSIKDMSNVQVTFFRTLLAVSTVIGIGFLLVSLILVLTGEVSKISNFALKETERYYGCDFTSKATESLSYYGAQSKIQCSEKFSEAFLAYMPKIDGTEVNQCIEIINHYQRVYLAFDLNEYENSVCTLFVIAKQFSPNIIEKINLKITGELLVSFLSIISSLVLAVVNSFWSLSIFIVIFMITVQEYDKQSKHLNIFGKKKQDLVNQVTSILSAAVFITLQHLALGLVLLTVFRFSEINTLISLFLSFIALIPRFQPHLIMFIFATINILWTGHIIAPLLCAVLYWHFSGYIYKEHYKDIDLHIFFVNLSILFGIYQYGVSGIVYGPLIVQLFKCVYDTLFISNKH